MLEVDGLEVRYGTRVAVTGASMSVAPGEIVCLLGPSGSGKTSLLRGIAGLERPTAGRVRWAGDDVTDVPPHERRFGMVFQDFALFPHRDVGDNVAFGLRMRGLDRDRVAEMLDLVGLDGYERRSPATLSGGEAQRVALARALAPGSVVLLLDEPLGALDRPLRARLTSELRALVRELGVAAVHVTHDQQEALAIADRVAVLRDGRIVQVGTPAEVWRRPVDEGVARFLGFANLLADAGGVRVVPPDAVSLGADGRAGAVRSVTFTGGGFAVVVDLDDGVALEVPVRSDAIPALGDRVRVVVDARLTTVVPAVP